MKRKAFWQALYEVAKKSFLLIAFLLYACLEIMVLVSIFLGCLFFGSPKELNVRQIFCDTSQNICLGTIIAYILACMIRFFVDWRLLYQQKLQEQAKILELERRKQAKKRALERKKREKKMALEREKQAKILTKLVLKTCALKKQKKKKKHNK